MTGSLESHADPALSKIADALKEIRAFFYDVNRREIKPKNLAKLETDLRNNLKEIDTSPVLKKLISESLAVSADQVLFELGQVRNRLDLAADILEQRFTLAQRERLYQYYDEICVHLDIAIDLLQNTK